MLFVVDALLAGGKLLYSMEPDSICGEGVNIWAASGWGSPNATRRAAGAVRYLRCLLERELSQAQREIVQDRLRGARRDLVRVLAHDLRRGRLSSLAPAVSLLF